VSCCCQRKRAYDSLIIAVFCGSFRNYTNNKLQVQRNEMDELNQAQTHKINLLEARILGLEG
jgi:hypothetical protein